VPPWLFRGSNVQSTLRSFDLAHLAHLELLTPKPDESLHFFVNVMGMTESGRRGESVYLRGWDDYEHHTLKLTAAKAAGMGHFAFRATSPEALQHRVGVIERSGLGRGWTDGDLGHGPAYSFTTSDGHNMELYYETEWYTAPAELKPSLKNQAMRFPARGVNVRRLDHLNLLAADVSALRMFFEDVLGMRVTEKIVLDSGEEAGVWVTATNKTYDVAFTHDHYGAMGRFHHATYALDSREEVLRAADIFLENGVHIETGPHKHAVQQTFFLYVYEPGGNRVEVANAGARLMLAPDWQPVIWTETERKKGQAWGLKTIETFHTHGTPPIDQYTGPIKK
jgi:catechol 2,3-dioxygenase